MTITTQILSWRDSEYPWMNDSQLQCFQMLADLCGGAHHIGGKIKPSSADGIFINLIYGFHASTFDYSDLTRAVFMAHDRCIRFQISPSGPNMLKLFLHKRKGREGDTSYRHPTLNEAIDIYRKSYPLIGNE